ncbi:MAG: GAF domain-containing protein [Deltaproteobacteria bacterium]|nr:GAF domain-containing protein [Deltaproteobacteria bacterium]
MIYLIDEEKREAVLKAHRNVSEDYIRRAERIPYPKGITWKAINGGRIVNIEDAQKDPDTGPAGRDLGHHSNLGIPIFLEERVVGVIWFGSYKERRFDEREVNLLSTFGDQIAIAIAKAKQTEELKETQKNLEERNSNLSILTAISQAVHQSVDLNQLYRTVLDVTEDLKFIDLISLYLVEGEGDKREAVLRIHRGYPEEYLKKASRIPYPKGNIWKVIETGKSVFYEDASDPSTPVGPAGKALGQRSLLSIPIKSGSETIGVTDFSSFTKRRFSGQELDFLLALGNQVGTAIAKAKMFKEIEQREEALRSSEERYRAIVEDQTELICRFLPDGTLTFVNESYCRYFAKKREELIGRSFIPLIPDEDQEICKNHLASFRWENPVTTIEHCVLMPSGEVCWQRWTDRAIFDQEGNIGGFQSVGRDITERKRAGEASLQRSHQLEILSHVSQEINTVLEIPIVMRTLIASAMELVEAEAGMSGLMVNGKMIFTEYNKKGELIPIDYTFEQDYGVPGWAMNTKKPYICNDAENDPHVISEIR